MWRARRGCSKYRCSRGFFFLLIFFTSDGTRIRSGRSRNAVLSSSGWRYSRYRREHRLYGLRFAAARRRAKAPGKIYAFEPDSASFATLEEIIRRKSLATRWKCSTWLLAARMGRSSFGITKSIRLIIAWSRSSSKHCGLPVRKSDRGGHQRGQLCRGSKSPEYFFHQDRRAGLRAGGLRRHAQNYREVS